MAVDKKLKSIRDEIDSIDEEILSLINERASSPFELDDTLYPSFSRLYLSRVKIGFSSSTTKIWALINFL